MKDFAKHLTGTAGEMAVGSKLCLQGWVPSLTTNNCPTLDILCYNPENKKNVSIQVKTIRLKYGQSDNVLSSNGYLLGFIKHKSLFEDLKEIATPFVFVTIDNNDIFKFYILSSDDLKQIAIKIDEDYNGHQKRQENRFKETECLGIPLRYLTDSSLNFEENWHKIWE